MKKASNLLRPAIVVLAIATISTLCFAILNGSITGTVKDNITGEEIPFANITLKEVNNPTLKSISTDLSGKFEFKDLAPGVYQIEISAIGYTKHRETNIKIAEGQTINNIFKLNKTSISLSEVVITEEKVQRIEKSITSNYIVAQESNKRSRRRDNQSQGLISISAEPYNTEQYNYLPENEFHETIKTPLSTFSIDVDGASYANVRRMINDGMLPPVDAVRVEEFINYFKYDYPQPKGNDPFSITTEVSICPWNESHQLISIGLQGRKAELQSLPPSNLVFLVDVSGSMMPENKLPLLVKSLSMLTDNLRKQDRIAIVVYAGNAGLVLPSTGGDEKSTIHRALESLDAGGSTAGGAGIQLAYKIANDNFIINGNNRVIMATDGDFNIGVTDDGSLIRMIEQKREQGIFLTVLGFGTGNLKDSKMEQMANKGNGNYAYIDNIMEAKKVLVNEIGGTLFTIAKDVKLQLEFNPEFVKSYKLIGYENRMLEAKDFNDDKKDAGELGNGHTVTALYEIIPTSNNEQTVSVDPLKYQQHKIVSTGNNEILTVKFRYKEPGANISKLITQTIKNKVINFENASNNLKFSTAVASFGMVLRDSKYKGTSNYKSILTIARSAKGEDYDGYRAEFIRLVEMASLIK